MKWNIQKLVKKGNDFVYENIGPAFNSAESALYSLNLSAKACGWKFRADKSLFGGYWVDSHGNCYGVR